jgi:hypothetical protein
VTKVLLKDAVADTEPQDVWQNFYALTQIARLAPRGGGTRIRGVTAETLRAFTEEEFSKLVGGL